MRFFALFALVCAGFLVGDELILKDGRRLRGEVERRGDFFILRTNYGWVRINARDVVGFRREAKKGTTSVKPVGGSFNNLFREGMALLEKEKVKEGRLRLLKSLLMRPHDVRIWLALGFVPKGAKWGYRPPHRPDRSKTPAPPSETSCPLDSTKMRKLVESGLKKLSSKLARRERLKTVIPMRWDRGYRSRGWIWTRTPYGWAWVELPWKWSSPLSWGIPVYRGSRGRLVLTFDETDREFQNRGRRFKR